MSLTCTNDNAKSHSPPPRSMGRPNHHETSDGSQTTHPEDTHATKLN